MDFADLWADALKETGAETYDKALLCFAQKVASAQREACASQVRANSHMFATQAACESLALEVAGNH